MSGSRRSQRWRGFWYGATRLYYVTLVIQDRRCLLGEVQGTHVALSPAGSLVRATWMGIARRFPRVRLDEFVVMPNHVHGILGFREPQQVAVGPTGRSPGGVASGRGSFGTTLGELVGWFKVQTTRGYVWGVRQDGWEPFPGRLWQRNYYDRVIRDEQELLHGRAYILENPRRWARDRENPNY